MTKETGFAIINGREKRFAAIAQSAERILGKDEVISSNLISSSKQPRDSIESRGFGFVRGKKSKTGWGAANRFLTDE